MKTEKKLSKFFLISLSFFFFYIQKANAVSISLVPSEVIQGEPVLIQIDGAKISDIKKITFNNKSLWFFNYQNKPTSLLGIDLRFAIGTYPVDLFLKNGSSTEANLIVNERQSSSSPMEVPESLGGNSPENQTKVVNDLAQENALLAYIKTSAKKFWQNKFIYPLAGPIIITDPYGYSRQTGAYTIAHKGTDFKADIGTKVLAVNKGIVLAVKNFKIYGKTVVIDHGLGVMSFYLHLSKIKVSAGELAEQGQVIGLSGDTGYVTGPHLHFSIRINNSSVDPIKFLNLFK